MKDATAEDIAKAEFNQTLSVQIANVRKSALEFKFQQASSAGVVSEEAAIAEIDSQVAIQAAELDKAVSLDPALGKLEKQKLDATQKRAIDFLKAQTAANLEIDQFNADVASAVFDKQFSNTLQLEQMAQTFAAEQSALDRALRRDELATAQTSAAALDELARGQLALQESQFKLDVFSTLIQSPQILAFLGEAGIAQFGDLLGDGGAAIQELIANVSEGGPAANIQQFARLSPQEQATEAFRISALSGTAPGDIGTSLQQAAPTAAFQTSGLRTSRLGL